MQEIAKNKLYIAVCGLIDSGKSTFIKTAVKLLNNMDLPIDSLCDEHERGITIKQSSIACPYHGIDFVFLDCPGHKEYSEEIDSGLSKASILIKIVDSTREEESLEYLKFIDYRASVYGNRIKNTFTLYSKSEKVDNFSYDAYNNHPHFIHVVRTMLDEIARKAKRNKKQYFIDPVETAQRVIKMAFELEKQKNPTLMCSYGKDSVVLLQMAKMAGILDKVKILYLDSGFDMDGISEEYKKEVQKYFEIQVVPFRGVPKGWNFENHSIHEIMKAKASAITNVLKKYKSELTFIGSRRHEGDGTRAKDKFFAIRDKDGKADLYYPKLEIYGQENVHIESLYDLDYANCRVSPLLDFTEIDIWKIIDHFKLPVCQDYFSKDGFRYRSLGDKQTTVPIKSSAKTIPEIIKEIELSNDTERICRSTQDNSEKYGMEKIRSVGFF